MSRIGKIARLPYSVRNELNQRLLNNEPGPDLVAWLNSREDVRAVLHARFESRAITEQNLSEWRAGGFEDWLRFQETRDWIAELVGKSADTLEETDTQAVTDWLATPLAVALGRCIHDVATSAPHSLEDRKNLIVLAREVCNLRRGDHQQQALRLKRDYFEATFKPQKPKSD
jgi:hypothetical protein